MRYAALLHNESTTLTNLITKFRESSDKNTFEVIYPYTKEVIANGTQAHRTLQVPLFLSNKNP